MQTETETTDTKGLDLIWGSEAIAHEIGRKPRMCAYLLETGQIPGARVVGRRWVVSRHTLRKFFGLTEDA